MNIYMVVIGRVFKGISMGILYAVLPVYISEVIAFRKGLALSILQLFSSCATLALYFIGNYLLTTLPNDASFRYTWLVEGIPALIFAFLCFILPESPKWYATQNKWTEAASVLDKLERNSGDKRNTLGDKEYVLSAYTLEPEIKIETYAAIFSKKNWRYSMMGMTVQLFSQLTGVSLLMYYFVYICEACGFHEAKSWMIMTQYSLLAVFTIFPVILSNRCRRKDVLVYGMVMLGLSFGLVCLLFHFYKVDSTSSMLENTPFNFEVNYEPASAILAICFFIVSVFSSTIPCASWMYTAEIFPIAIRSKGILLCMCVSWMLHVCLSLVIPNIFPFLSYWVLGIFSLVCIIGAGVIVCFPEARDLDHFKLEMLATKAVNEETNFNSNDLPVSDLSILPRKESIRTDLFKLKADDINRNQDQTKKYRFEMTVKEKAEDNVSDLTITSQNITGVMKNSFSISTGRRSLGLCSSQAPSPGVSVQQRFMNQDPVSFNGVPSSFNHQTPHKSFSTSKNTKSSTSLDALATANIIKSKGENNQSHIKEYLPRKESKPKSIQKVKRKPSRRTKEKHQELPILSSDIEEKFEEALTSRVDDDVDDKIEWEPSSSEASTADENSSSESVLNRNDLSYKPNLLLNLYASKLTVPTDSFESLKVLKDFDGDSFRHLSGDVVKARFGSQQNVIAFRHVGALVASDKKKLLWL